MLIRVATLGEKASFGRLLHGSRWRPRSWLWRFACYTLGDFLNHRLLLDYRYIFSSLHAKKPQKWATFRDTMLTCFAVMWGDFVPVRILRGDFSGWGRYVRVCGLALHVGTNL